MYRLPSEEKAHKEEIGALILSIIIIIAGIGGMIYTKRLSLEYKNSTDVRTMDALVYSCKQTDEKDDETEGSEEPDSQESSEDTEEDSAENAEEQDNAIADALEKAAKDEDKFEEELAEAEKEQDEEEASIHID